MANRLIAILATLVILILAAQIYFLNQENTRLTIDNKVLAKAILKPAVPKKVYVFGCNNPSAAVLVYSNGNSHLTEGKAQLMKLERRLPRDIPTSIFQAPECRSSGT